MKKFEKNELKVMSMEDLLIINKKYLLSSKIENCLEAARRKNIELFPKEVFGVESIEDVERYIKNFESDKKNEKSLINVFYKEYLTSLKIDKAYLNNQIKIEERVQEILYSDFVKEIFENRNEEELLRVIESIIVSIKNEVNSLMLVKDYQRDFYFKNFSILKIESYALSVLNHFEDKNKVLKEKAIEKDEELDLIKKILEDKKSIGFFGKSKENKKKEEDQEFFISTLNLVFRGVFETLYLILQSQEQLNKDRTHLTIKQLEDQTTKVSTYLSKINEQMSLRIKESLYSESKNNLKLKKEEVSFLKNILITNIIQYQSRMEKIDISELKRFF